MSDDALKTHIAEMERQLYEARRDLHEERSRANDYAHHLDVERTRANEWKERCEDALEAVGKLLARICILEGPDGAVTLRDAGSAKPSAPTCAVCGKPASCIGEYETCTGIDQYACDSCCGHGNEDGHCKPVSSS